MMLFSPRALLPLITSVMLMSGWFGLRVETVRANTSNILDFYQVDLDGDGTPDKAVIMCSCVAANDRIEIYDGSNDMRWSKDWREGADLANDIWIFSIGARDRANLIIVFSSVGDEQVAHLYDDQDGDGFVAYEHNKGQIAVSESLYWTVEVKAQRDWFRNDGGIELNLILTIDGPFPQGQEFIDKSLAQRYMLHDGNPDVMVEVFDRDHNGIAEYMVSRLLVEFPERIEVGKSRLWFNGSNTPSAASPSALFWPLLNLEPADEPEESGRTTLRFFDLVPHVRIDWQRSALSGVIVPGYPIEEGFWLNNRKPILDGQLNGANYEAPHAWYDLAANRDGIPELNIRLFSARAGQSKEDWQEIRYSWNQTGLGTMVWDYKLGMMGQHPIDSVVHFPGFSVRMVPHEELPYWVAERTWKATTFVARETGREESAEGIYHWTPWAGSNPVSVANPSVEAHAAMSSYLDGIRETPPTEFFTEIRQGYRGEYQFRRPAKPGLYFSSVDRRLHLNAAEAGLWNVDDQHEVRYADLNDDGYLDQWTYYEVSDGQQVASPLRELNVAPAHLIYSDEHEVVLRQVQVELSLFETRPPTNHEEWRALGAQLEAHKPTFEGTDFRAMLQQFDGPELHITGATLADYRPLADGGSRFTLVLRDGFQVEGEDLLKLGDRPAGTYSVRLGGDGGVELEPATPASLLATVHIGGAVPPHVKRPLQVTLYNAGTQALHAAELVLMAIAPDGTETTIGVEPVAVPGREEATVTLQWAPGRTGEWHLTPQLRLPDAQIITLERMTVTVAGEDRPSPTALMNASTSTWQMPLIALGLIGAALGAAAAFVHGWQRSPEE